MRMGWGKRKVDDNDNSRRRRQDHEAAVAKERAMVTKNYLQAVMVEMNSEARAEYLADMMAYCEDRFVTEFGKALESKRTRTHT